MKNISVVIPVYQAEKTLDELYTRLTSTLVALGVTYEIILVDDRSTDGTWGVVRTLCEKDNCIRGCLLSRNFGQHSAITAGLNIAEGEWVVVMDCDLQDQPEEIKKLYQTAVAGFDLVLAKRKNRQDDWLKRLGSVIFYFVFRHLTKSGFNSSYGNFGIYSKKVIDAVKSMGEQHRSFGLLVNWLGFSKAEIEVEHSARFAGKSTYSFKKRLHLALDSFTSYSNGVLSLFIRAGILFSGLSTIAGIILICRYLVSGVHTPGWTSVIVVSCFLGGLILAANGILGLYIGKIFDETKKRPIYVVDSLLSSK
jgi:dolichol-phosphate mannosyltransferase